MLIIAQPKSASTALMDTLGILHDLPAQQAFNAEFQSLKPSRELRILDQYHYDIRELNECLALKLNDDFRFMKHHIPPTANNRRRLSDARLVILLRDPRDTVLAYRRGILAGVHNPLRKFEGCETETAWLRRADEVGLIDDLEFFIDGWRDDEGEHLIIWYRDLIAAPSEQIKQIQQFWGLPVTQAPISLVKRRYSRYNGFEAFSRRLLQGLANHAVATSRKLGVADGYLYCGLRKVYRWSKNKLERS